MVTWSYVDVLLRITALVILIKKLPNNDDNNNVNYIIMLIICMQNCQPADLTVAEVPASWFQRGCKFQVEGDID